MIIDDVKMEVGENLLSEVLPSLKGNRKLPIVHTPFTRSFVHLARRIRTLAIELQQYRRFQ